VTGVAVVTDHNADQRPPAATGDQADAPAAPTARRAADGTMRALAARLGVSPRTLYKWIERGAPRDTTDEATWRAWCAAHRIRRLRPALEPIDVDVPRGTEGESPEALLGDDDLDGDEAGDEKPPATAPATAGDDSPLQAKYRREGEVKALQAKELRMRIAQAQRVLIHRDHVARLFAAFAASIVDELRDLPPRALRALESVPEDYRRPMRKALEATIVESRDRLRTHLRAHLAAALNPETKADG